MPVLPTFNFVFGVIKIEQLEINRIPLLLSGRQNDLLIWKTLVLIKVLEHQIWCVQYGNQCGELYFIEVGRSPVFGWIDNLLLVQCVAHLMDL